MNDPLPLNPVEIMKSNMDSLSAIITFGCLIGKVSPLQLLVIGLFQSMLYHSNRFAVDLVLGGVDDIGGTTVTHVFGAMYGCATALTLYKTIPGFKHPDHQERYVSGMYANPLSFFSLNSDAIMNLSVQVHVLGERLGVGCFTCLQCFLGTRCLAATCGLEQLLRLDG
jgi:hypothetical protein